MRISPITSFAVRNKVNNNSNFVQNPLINSNKTNDTFIKSPAVEAEKPVYTHRQVSFNGINIHIIDGGKHADEMAQFIKNRTKKVDIKLHRSEQTEFWDLNKPLKNVLEQLKEINKFGLTDKDSYVAIPVKITVPLQNLAEQYKRVMGYYLHLRPHTTKTCQQKIMDFLQVLYTDPEKHKKYIRYMDPNNQGIEYAYGIIQEINSLNCKKVYVPAEHPQYETLNWLAGERGETPELTNYLATGYDKDGKVHNMLNYIKGQNWYDFNLLSLAKVNVVNLKKADGFSDHIYSAYDMTVNDGARGVFNLSPVRENGRIVGFSYKDMTTNEYPYVDFPYRDEIKDIEKFVGRKVDDVVADDAATDEFRRALEANADTRRFSEKLYPVWKLFDENKLNNDKIYDKGDFVDASLNNYFRRNSNYEIIYPKADCENNGRPSVKAMWGSDYAMLNAIKRDVEKQQFVDQVTQGYLNFNDLVVSSYSDAIKAESSNNLYSAEACWSKTLEYIDMVGFDRQNINHLLAHKHMGDIKMKLGDYAGANWHYNVYINNLSKNHLKGASLKNNENLNYLDEIANTFKKLAEVAKQRGENYSEMECRRAASEIYAYRFGPDILNRRANDDLNIGDIFG